jgi:hypothetical protein
MENIPDFAKNYEMKRNAPRQSASEQKTFIKDMSDDDLRKLAREQLSKALQAVDAVSQPEMTRKLCAELMDRLDGKPGQAITMDATVRQITVNATIEFVQPTGENKLITIDN